MEANEKRSAKGPPVRRPFLVKPLVAVAIGDAHSVDLKSNLFGVPLGFPVMTFVVALDLIQLSMVLEAASPNALLYSAATPATCGEAIDVPLIVRVLLPIHVDVMLDPGAYTSTQLPKFENDDFASLIVDDATVVAAPALDGEKLHALALLLPAATAMNTPAFDRLVVAVLSDEEKPPPSDMLATAGLMWFTRTQSRPAMIPEVDPDPLQLSTRTPRSIAPFATPYVWLATVPPTCVPCP